VIGATGIIGAEVVRALAANKNEVLTFTWREALEDQASARAYHADFEFVLRNKLSIPSKVLLAPGVGVISSGCSGVAPGSPSSSVNVFLSIGAIFAVLATRS
jgi:uncharacterized protein YbjT (DUF2867 family)